MKQTEIASSITDANYKQWIVDIEKRFRQQQVKAAIHINSDKIEFYWSLGRDICEMQVEKRYGEAIMNVLSRDLRTLLPDASGLTPINLYYCKRFYLLYTQIFRIFPQVVEKFKPLHAIAINDSSLPLNIFAIPWGHHRTIIDYYEQEPEKALFYAMKTIENSWSRATLENMMGDKGRNNGLYERQGKAVNNFASTLPLPTGDLARELIKDPLNLSFVKLKETYTEENLKQALINHQ